MEIFLPQSFTIGHHDPNVAHLQSPIHDFQHSPILLHQSCYLVEETAPKHSLLEAEL